MKILICGGRDFTDEDLFYEFMDYWIDENVDVEEDITIITGMAKGADTLAYDYANAIGDGNLECYPADWEKHGRAAGPIRNQQMLTEGKPDVVIAFPGGRGTAHMISIAKKAGVPVVTV